MEMSNMDIMSTILHTIKVVINNRNRLTTTKNMVEKLLSLNPDEQIIILDNGSTYPPLLEWYQGINDRVEVRMGKNEGHLALWAIGLDRELGEHFVYTDSDLELNPDFPKNWKEIMLDLIYKYDIKKVGLALEVGDLPDFYRYKNQVVRNEGRWWLTEVEQGVFLADTDTTFALMVNNGHNEYKSVRVAKNGFTCRHMPFYVDLSNLSEEEKYYLDHHDLFFTTQYTKQHINPEIYNDI